ncbi:unnamed protein product, partial [Symbiodinium necroappetens]
DKEVILAEMGAAFEHEDPLPIAEDGATGGGVQDVFCKQKAAAALQDQNVYRASISVWWLQLIPNHSPGIPLNRARVEAMRDFYYGTDNEPRFLTQRMIEVMAPDDLSAPRKLVMVSPEELVHCLLLAFADSIRRSDELSKADWDKKKARWRAVMLSVPAAFMKLPDNVSADWALAFNRRQAVHQDHESLSRTGLQQVMEIMLLKGKIEAAEPPERKMSLKAEELLAKLKSAGLQNVKYGGRAGDKDEGDGPGALTVNMIDNCINVHSKLLGNNRIVEIILENEDRYGSASFAHQLSTLAAVAAKCTNMSMREWVMESIVDAVTFDVKSSNADYTKSSISGDKTHAGWAALYELKFEVMKHFLHSVLPTTTMSPKDLGILKSRLGSHKCYREGKDDVSWKSHLSPSGIAVYEFLEELVFEKVFDSSLRMSAKQGGGADQVLEHQQVKSRWDDIVLMLKKEKEERDAAEKLRKEEATAAGEDGDRHDADETTKAVNAARAAPTSLAKGTPAYWRAVANGTVRSYVTFAVEPKTQDQVATIVSQSSLKDLDLETGEKAVMVFLDVENLGESMGPNCQKFLRRKFGVTDKLLRKLVHGAMSGRGSQKRNDEGEVTVPVETDIVCIHTGTDRASADKEAKNLFKLSTSKAGPDCDIKEVNLIFNDSSIRSRRRINRRTAYSVVSNLTLATQVPMIPRVIKEKKYTAYAAHNSSDCIALVMALQPADMWHLPRTEKEQVLTNERSVTAAAIEKSAAEAENDEAEQGQDETVFSAACLTKEFFTEFLRCHSAAGAVDLAIGQGECLKACLALRIPAVGIALSDPHSKHVELALTEYVLKQMSTEGSTFYRAEAAQALGEAAATEKKKKKNDDDGDDETQPMKKPRSKKTAKPKKQKEGQEDDEDDADEKDEPKKKSDNKKKRKKQDESDGGESSSSLPWK